MGFANQQINKINKYCYCDYIIYGLPYTEPQKSSAIYIPCSVASYQMIHETSRLQYEQANHIDSTECIYS